MVPTPWSYKNLLEFLNLLMLFLHGKCVSCIFHNQYAPMLINAAIYTAHMSACVSLALYVRKYDQKHILKPQVYFSAFTHTTTVSVYWTLSASKMVPKPKRLLCRHAHKPFDHLRFHAIFLCEHGVISSEQGVSICKQEKVGHN